MDFTLETLQNILAAFGGLVIAASIVVKYTKTEKDDAIVAKIRNILDYVSIVTKK